MRLLTISSLYPNHNEPKHGIFVRNRLCKLLEQHPDVKATVIAPVPWYPFKHGIGPFKDYTKFAGVKKQELRDGLEVYHPKYLVIPKVGMYLTPFFMYWAIKRCVKRLIKQGQQFDLIDGHYFYPDGVAIGRIATDLGLPYTLTARGTDINLIPHYPIAKKMIIKTAEQAGYLITVCKALKDELITFAAVENKTTVLRNGVDLAFFNATNSEQQQTLKQQRLTNNKHKLIVSVGHLIERKGHHLVIEAISQLQNCHLVIAGDGPLKEELKQQIRSLGLQDRVELAGALSQAELRTLYQSADALVLASSREGWANVLLESMACGTPVVATNLWGTPEVVAAPEAGVLVERTSQALAGGLNALFAHYPTREATRLYAEQFSWDETSQGQYRIFHSLFGQKQTQSFTVENVEK